MSDITKKIFSIEPLDAVPGQEPNASDIIRPISRAKSAAAVGQIKTNVQTEKLPEFVTREEIKPLSTPPTPRLEDEGTRRNWAIWTIVGFGLLYVISAALYFGMPLLKDAPTLFSTTGLILLLILPIALLVLLGLALRNLMAFSDQNQAFVRAADILVSPETEALARTQSLAGSIRAEISKFNEQLRNTVECLEGVQISVSKETQALDEAGGQLATRSEDVGRNLTLQRQALESISGTFDVRMGTLAAQITETSRDLETVCVEAETRLSKAGGSLIEATAQSEVNITAGTDKISEKITELGDVTRKLDTTSEALTSDLGVSAQHLVELESQLENRAETLQDVNQRTESQISDLQTTIAHGTQMLSELQSAADLREQELAGLYDRLSNQLKKSEDDTLASQGQTARVVEANLSQMRRDFGRMETELKSLQVKLNNLRDTSNALPEPDMKHSRLNLTPLISDFPPVEPPRHGLRGASTVRDTPFNLGADLELETPESDIFAPVPDVIKRPGQPLETKKGFGRSSEKDTGGWKWRDMLGGLEKPDVLPVQTIASVTTSPDTPKVDIVERLTALKLAPSAIVDEGTVIDATQARINAGETGLATAALKHLPDAASHLKARMASDISLTTDITDFTEGFAKVIGSTPPSAPALRATLGSPQGRAYLICVAALQG